ncbi:MAG: VCBS repeat-containing protein [Chloroflexi bacterium]|nr:VCBS repeat-containing protein [Chloroflexota bacterium]
MTKRLIILILAVALLAAACDSQNVPATSTTAANTPTQPPTTAPTAKPVSPTAPPTAGPPLTGSGAGVIAFYSERDGNGEIYIMNADGSDQRRLTFNNADDFTPAWSPDGKQIAFTSDRDDPQPRTCFPNCTYQLYLMNVDGTEQGSGDQRQLTNLPNGVDHPAWSPDGTMITFDADPEGDGKWAIYVINAQEANSSPRPLTDGKADDRFADWSPDGTQIAFSSNRDGNLEIYVMDADGSNQRRLTDSDLDDYFPAWSPPAGGKQIAFFSVKWPTQKQDICVMAVPDGTDADGTNVHKLTNTLAVVDEDPAWSPDGKQIAFQSDRNGNFEIYVMDVDGSNPSRLTNSPSGDYWPAWKPMPAGASGSFSLTKSAQGFPRTGTFQAGLGDLDGDGDLDAVFANPMRSYSGVWLNDGTGQFTDTGQQLTQYGHGVGVADLDGDGDLDAFIACHQFVNPSRVYLNDGKAILQDTGQDLGDANVSAADLNLVDINGDGHMDAHVVYYDPHGKPDKVYLNDGTGTFNDSGLALDEYVIAWGDLDADGDTDMLGKREREGYVVRLNDGTGQFAEGWQMEDSHAQNGAIALADFDGDGDLDALIANGFRTGGSYPTILLWNDGRGQFTDSGQRLNATMGGEFGVGDLDGDGDLDVFVSNFDLPNEVWLNDGAGHLADSGLRLGKNTDMSTRSSLGDLDGDGDLDVFVGSLAGQPEVWFNTTP